VGRKSICALDVDWLVRLCGNVKGRSLKLAATVKNMTVADCLNERIPLLQIRLWTDRSDLEGVSIGYQQDNHFIATSSALTDSSIDARIDEPYIIYWLH
jgi:hypothetical protein